MTPDMIPRSIDHGYLTARAVEDAVLGPAHLVIDLDGCALRIPAINLDEVEGYFVKSRKHVKGACDRVAAASSVISTTNRTQVSTSRDGTTGQSAIATIIEVQTDITPCTQKVQTTVIGNMARSLDEQLLRNPRREKAQAYMRGVEC